MHNRPFKQLALIGSTASGKTSLSIQLAQKMNAYILSLDSLAIYKEIDIASAKPTIQERAGIKHFGIDYQYIYEAFDVQTFIKLYHDVHKKCLQDNKNLIIVGGTSFYLKMLIDGVSLMPTITQAVQNKVHSHLLDLPNSYKILHEIDPIYMNNIASNDSYRIEKALQIYFQTNLAPSEYFKQNPQIPTITDTLPIYQIVWERSELRKRIALRTQMMLDNGLIDEVTTLEKKYSRKPHAMNSIGIKETLAYLDGIYTKKELLDKITTNTAKLAKRQATYNNSQFKEIIKGSVEALENILL